MGRQGMGWGTAKFWITSVEITSIIRQWSTIYSQTLLKGSSKGRLKIGCLRQATPYNTGSFALYFDSRDPKRWLPCIGRWPFHRGDHISWFDCIKKRIHVHTTDTAFESTYFELDK